MSDQPTPLTDANAIFGSLVMPLVQIPAAKYVLADKYASLERVAARMAEALNYYASPGIHTSSGANEALAAWEVLKNECRR